MTDSARRANYDLIAHLYDEPGRDYDTDPNLVKFLKENPFQRPSSVRILDMGCGTGKQLTANRRSYPELGMVGLDLFHGMLQQAYKRCALIDWIQGDSAFPPFNDCSFDYITNQFSYHHVQNKKRMIVETYRILKPGGRFAITNLDPWYMAGWIVYTYFPASRRRDLSDFLSLNELSSLMEKAGFRNIAVKRQVKMREENLKEFLGYATQRYRTSQLIAIDDSDYDEGIARLKARVARLGRGFSVPSRTCLIFITGDKSR